MTSSIFELERSVESARKMWRACQHSKTYGPAARAALDKLTAQLAARAATEQSTAEIANEEAQNG